MDSASQAEIESLRRRVSELEAKLTGKPGETASGENGEHSKFQLAELEQIYQTAPVGIGFLDTSLRYLRVNQRLAAINGLPEREHIGRRVADVLPAIAHLVEPYYRRAIDTGEPILDLEVKGRTRLDSGVDHSYRVSYYPVKDAASNVLGVTTVVQDVTRQKAAEKELEALNQRLAERAREFDTLLDVIPMGIHLAHDPECRSITLNRYFYDVLGVEPGTNVSKSAPPNEATAPYKVYRNGRELEADELPLQKAIRTGKEVRNEELDLAVSNGRRLSLFGHAAPLFDHDGHVTGALSAFLDITERKRAEQERSKLLQRERELRGEAERTLQLEQSVERQLMLLVEASGTLLASPGSEEVLQTILSLAARFVEADAYAVWRKAESEREWHVVAKDGLSDSYELKVADIAENSARLTSGPSAVEDVEQSTLVGYRKAEYKREGITSMLTVPLRIHGQIDATMVFYHRSPHRFTPVETCIAGALGNLAASALGTADLYRREMELRTMAQAAESRARFVAQAGELLSSSLDYETTLRSVAKLAIPAFADWCAVDINQGGHLERVIVEHADPAMIELASEFRRKYPPQADDFSQTVFLAGQAILVEDVPEEAIAERVSDPEKLRMVKALRIRSLIIAPMVARGKSLGLMIFANSEASRRYRKDDLALAKDLARRAAIAIDNAALYSEARSAVTEREESLRREQAAREQAEMLNRIGPLLSAELDPRKLAEKVTDIATRLIGAELGALFHNVVTENGESLTLYTLSGVPYEAFANFPMPRNTAVFGPTFRGEGAVRSDDITADLRYGKNAPYHGMPEGHPPVRSYLAVPVVSRSGEVLGALFFGHSRTGVFTSQSEELVAGIAAQAAIALDNARLFSESEQAQTALRRTNDDLRRANEDLNQFAYSASHDLREPLRMVALYSQMLQKKYHDALDAQANEFIAYTVQGASRLEMLVKDLLAYTQAANFGTENVPVVNANEAIDRALANLERSIEESGASVTHGLLPAVPVQEIHLVQLFQNLIGNALKYRSHKPPHVAISAERANFAWVFSVQDNGIGIDPQYKEQIFGLFKRLHTTADYTGTGIGLAICQKIVERYGGSIWVESTVGEGSTFHFTIPDRESSAA